MAAAIYADKIFKQIGLPTDFPLSVTASVLEEDYEGLCWKYILEEDKIKPEAILLTETNNLAICAGQRGRLELKLQVRGVSGHSSTPEWSDNAIYKMNPIIREIEGLNGSLTGMKPLGKGRIAVTDTQSTAPSLGPAADPGRNFGNGREPIAAPAVISQCFGRCYGPGIFG